MVGCRIVLSMARDCNFYCMIVRAKKIVLLAMMFGLFRLAQFGIDQCKIIVSRLVFRINFQCSCKPHERFLQEYFALLAPLVAPFHASSFKIDSTQLVQ